MKDLSSRQPGGLRRRIAEQPPALLWPCASLVCFIITGLTTYVVLVARDTFLDKLNRGPVNKPQPHQR